MTVRSADIIAPSYKDLVSYVLNHDNYDVSKKVLIDAIDPRQHITLHKARRIVRKLVSGFAQYGVQDNDTVCMHLFNHIMYPVLFLGIVGSGGRFTGSNPAYTATELSHHLATSQARFVITARMHLNVVEEAAVANGISPDRIFVFDHDGKQGCDRFSSLAQLVHCGERQWRVFDDQFMSENTTAALMSTSGTTGLPKMAVRSHLSWVVENQAIEERAKKSYTVRRLLTAPFFHAFAAPLALVSALRSGHTTYVLHRYNQDDFLSAIKNLKITETAMPPPLIVRFLALPAEPLKMLSSVQLVWSGGAPLAKEIQNEALRMFAPKARICQVYGMTEGGWMTTFLYPESDREGSVGRLIGSYEAKIVDDDGQQIEDAPGEILIRGPINMREYLNNEAATRDVFDSNQWLRTGDVGYFDMDGKLYVSDRKKELIKVRGWQVAPGELEGCLLKHEDIVDAAVIGIPRPLEASEVPRAYLVRKEGSTVSAKEIVQFLLQYLSKYKVGECEVQFCDSIPKSSTGKILRKILREQSERERHDSADPD